MHYVQFDKVVEELRGKLREVADLGQHQGLPNAEGRILRVRRYRGALSRAIDDLCEAQRMLSTVPEYGEWPQDDKTPAEKPKASK